MRQLFLGEIVLEQLALLSVRCAPIEDACAERLLERRLAGLEARSEIRPGPPILPDDDLDFFGKPRGRARAQRLATRRERERAVRQLLANADAAQPAQETNEVGGRQAE